ncbi:uncharacterized protein B0P05DRAFT_575884 [Gilbertella persicaria]|uniref:uncharacterized protein n=1 Tax=Gilbertella persicaria TaxID=101096 RepID=UPI00221F7D06|nr:uncharacterized protein B0P05DRAFT_575884 [Gilbertella persicaria]KAI8049444.1 hypothetical protein B0P05DRAFT_575884 [Gilbertella persicaria]
MFDILKNITSCTFQCKGYDSHDVFRRLHLSVKNDILIEKVENDQLLKPKKLNIGVASHPGEFDQLAKGTSSVLKNQDRAKYQLNATKASLGIRKNSDFLGDLAKI